jgi:hypothetical protein
MAEFKRSRLERKTDETITKKTIILGLLTLLLFLLVVLFGLPFLIRFSIFLGEIKNRKDREVKEKILPPLPPRLVIPFEATNSARLIVKGVAEAGVLVELLKNDASIGKVEVPANGEFAFEDIMLDEGENSFNALAMTEKGGSSELSKTIITVYDNKAPELKMLNPSEEAIKVDNPDFDVVGQSEKGVSVLVGGQVAMVDDEGKFKLKKQLNMGKNEVEIIVRDTAGNETRKKIEITYDI